MLANVPVLCNTPAITHSPLPQIFMSKPAVPSLL